MSIEQDWKWLFDYEFFDSPGCLGKQLRCMFDLHDRLKRVEKRLGSIQSDVDVALDTVIEKDQPDPSEWVGDLCMFDSDYPPTFHHGPYVCVGEIAHGLHMDQVGHGWLHVRPATDEERIRYKGEPPTMNGDLCCVRDCERGEWSVPVQFVGIHPVSGRFVTTGAVENCNWTAPWKYARKLTPKELKQHQAGEESE